MLSGMIQNVHQPAQKGTQQGDGSDRPIDVAITRRGRPSTSTSAASRFWFVGSTLGVVRRGGSTDARRTNPDPWCRRRNCSCRTSIRTTARTSRTCSTTRCGRASRFSSRHPLRRHRGQRARRRSVVGRSHAGRFGCGPGYRGAITSTSPTPSTRPVSRTRQEVLDEALPDLFENRAAIEQAKGVLMVVYRVSAEQAFRVFCNGGRRRRIPSSARWPSNWSPRSPRCRRRRPPPKSARPSVADGARAYPCGTRPIVGLFSRPSWTKQAADRDTAAELPATNSAHSRGVKAHGVVDGRARGSRGRSFGARQRRC